MQSGRKSYFLVDNPSALEIRFELTMTLGEWIELLDDLPENNGDNAGRLRRMLSEMLKTAQRGVETRYGTTGWATSPEGEPQ